MAIFQFANCNTLPGGGTSRHYRCIQECINIINILPKNKPTCLYGSTSFSRGANAWTNRDLDLKKKNERQKRTEKLKDGPVTTIHSLSIYSINTLAPLDNFQITNPFWDSP